MAKPRSAEQATKQRSLMQEAWLQFKSNRLAICGLIVIGLLLLISIVTTVIDLADGGALYKQLVTKQNLLEKLDGPSAAHILGCDEYGRDLFFRILWGTRYSLFAGVCTILAAVLIGGLFGAMAGYYGGKLDNVIMRVMDMMMTVPSLVLAMAIVAALGSSLVNLLIALATSQIPSVCAHCAVFRNGRKGQRIRGGGKGGWRFGCIDYREIHHSQCAFPGHRAGNARRCNNNPERGGHVVPGLGNPAPAPEWGSILSSARVYMREAWHISVFPGLAIVICILSLNLLGDGLRDALDPKQKR